MAHRPIRLDQAVDETRSLPTSAVAVSTQTARCMPIARSPTQISALAELPRVSNWQRTLHRQAREVLEEVHQGAGAAQSGACVRHNDDARDLCMHSLAARIRHAVPPCGVRGLWSPPLSDMDHRHSVADRRRRALSLPLTSRLG